MRIARGNKRQADIVRVQCEVRGQRLKDDDGPPDSITRRHRAKHQGTALRTGDRARPTALSRRCLAAPKYATVVVQPKGPVMEALGAAASLWKDRTSEGTEGLAAEVRPPRAALEIDLPRSAQGSVPKSLRSHLTDVARCGRRIGPDPVPCQASTEGTSRESRGNPLPLRSLGAYASDRVHEKGLRRGRHAL